MADRASALQRLADDLLAFAAENPHVAPILSPPPVQVTTDTVNLATWMAGCSRWDPPE
jgi:hypothetical protein